MKGVHISSMYLVVVTSLLISTPIACDAEEDRGKLDEAEDGGTEEADPEAPASCDILSSVVGTLNLPLIFIGCRKLQRTRADWSRDGQNAA